MADAGYFAWLSAGEPFQLAKPLADLKRILKAHGFTVYDYPDESHQTANPAQDHTPYSETGWPVPSPRWWGHAIDIMPAPSGKKSPITGLFLPTLQQLGAQILKDRKDGVPGISHLKYMNWEPTGNNTGPCYQETFKPNYQRFNSTDRGHIHVSQRSDMTTNDTVAQDYDPVSRIQGVDMAVDLTPAALQDIRRQGSLSLYDIVWSMANSVDVKAGTVVLVDYETVGRPTRDNIIKIFQNFLVPLMPNADQLTPAEIQVLATQIANAVIAAIAAQGGVEVDPAPIVAGMVAALNNTQLHVTS
jgi:hypothetical protein